MDLFKGKTTCYKRLIFAKSQLQLFKTSGLNCS